MTSAYPRPITRIHQIEISSECNLRCRYCAHPKMKRDKKHMSMAIFKMAMDHVMYLDANGGKQTELSLTGVGEAFLNPDFMDMLVYARSVYKGLMLFSTNGLLMTEEIAKELARLEVYVYVSLHRPEVAAKAITLARKYGILGDVNIKFATEAFDWAGQVDWEVTVEAVRCDYLFNGWAAVLQDGTITTCCMDAEGYNKIGHVNDELGSLFTEPKDLCGTCHMVPPVSIEIKEVANG